MKLLFDENIPRAVINHFREQGHDVVSVKESFLGANDPFILNKAQKSNYLIVTQTNIVRYARFHFNLLFSLFDIPARIRY